MLLCPSCHDKIARDAEGYPEQDLSNLHRAHRERIRLAASTPEGEMAIALIVQGQHFSTQNDIDVRAFLTAMSAEGLATFGHPVKLILDAPGPSGRDAAYWKQRYRSGSNRFTDPASNFCRLRRFRCLTGAFLISHNRYYVKCNALRLGLVRPWLGRRAKPLGPSKAHPFDL